MTRYFWVITVIFIFSLTSCGSTPSDTQPTDLSGSPEASPTAPLSDNQAAAPPITVTPLKPETPTDKPPTFTPTLEPPTSTPSPSATATLAEPTQTPTVTPTKWLRLKPKATQAFLGVQLGSPVGVQNFAHPDLGCQWMGAAGQVFDIDDTPMMGLVIEFGGTLADKPIFGLAITGQIEAYGPDGYEFKLADEPIVSSGTVWAQVFDLEGNAISSPTYFSTYADCAQNLILLNFVQAYKLPTDWVYLPVIYQGEK